MIPPKLKNYIAVLFLISSCNYLYDNPTALASESNENKKILSSLDLFGTYEGIQNGYFLKNKSGDYIVARGNKVPVPASNYKFLFGYNQAVGLEQSSAGLKASYFGVYKVIEDTEEKTIIECRLSDGEYSNPTMVIEYSKLKKTFTYKGADGAPNFNLEKKSDDINFD